MGNYLGFYIMPTPNDAGVIIRDVSAASQVLPWGPIVGQASSYYAATAAIDAGTITPFRKR